MGAHSSADARPEPVAIASAVQTILAAAVTFGWVQLDDARISAIGTVVALAAATYITIATRGAVTPNSSPIDVKGNPLVPAIADPAQVPAAKLLEREGRIRVLQ